MIKSKDCIPPSERTAFNQGDGGWGWRVRMAPVKWLRSVGTVGSASYLHSLVFPLPFHASVSLRWWSGLHFAVQEKGAAYSGWSGGGKRRCSEGRGEREGRINSNPSSSFFSVFLSYFFVPVVSYWCDALHRKEGHRNQEVRGKIFKLGF